MNVNTYQNYSFTKLIASYETKTAATTRTAGFNSPGITAGLINSCLVWKEQSPGGDTRDR